MNRPFLIFSIGLTIGFLGLCTARAQSASGAQKPVAGNITPVVKPRTATVQKPVIPNSNAITLAEPEKTKIVALYRGNGSFDEALAQKVRPALVKNFHLENEAQTASAASNPITRVVEALNLAPSLAGTGPR
ncbi:MAG: hypothetical protein JOZ08_25380 [Verrucomicrobia bacterium]|nr:hypothetical protein [Verrucomicrobiota bacterium]MBV8274620.1 hypothetical protein [Verrucomicrobiota bacterium]